MTVQTNRRVFLTGAAALGAALFVGIRPDGVLAAAEAPTAMNLFVKIGADGTVTVIAKHFEMGQGTTTGLATLVAEELDADWDAVRVEYAPSDNATYRNLAFGAQGTGGSTAIANSWMQYRQAGAAARAVLVKAAAEAWGVAMDAVTVENGMLTAGGNSAGFGEFAAAAAGMEAPAEPQVKEPSEFRLIGSETLRRKDSEAKTDGSAEFATDVRLPGMIHAVILRAPKFGSRVESVDASGAEGMPGFLGAKALPNRAGVAVYGTTTWAALSARDAVTAEWDFSEAETRSTDAILADHKALLETPQFEARKGGDRDASTAAVDGAETQVEAEFAFPFLAHAPMEPLTCTIEPLEGGGVRVHDGCQFPALAHPTVAGNLGLDPKQVEIRTMLAGGSFGRRATPTADYHAEAAMAFKLDGGTRPVKLVWSREDDIRGGYYRPMAVHRARIGITGGEIAGWEHRIAAKPIIKGSIFEAALVHGGVDHTSVEGIADSPYAIPAMSVGLSDAETEVPVLWWRAVGHTHTAYAMEVLMDMAAEAAGADPVAFRRGLLSGDDADSRRLTGVLDLVAEKAGWGSPAEGRFQGVSVHKSFNSYVALVAEVSLSDGAVKIERVVCAVDCGIAVNPDMVRAQMEGGIGFGLGAVMRNRIDLEDGEVVQSNFPDYEPIRMSDMPAIEVHVVASGEAPTGVGEPGTPPAGPALANAIFKATGQRITSLPMTDAGIEFA